MTDAALATRMRDVFLERMLPDWSKRAACAELAPNRAPWDAMFRDDVAYKATEEYNWPAEIKTALSKCAGCPVRRECLEYALGIEGEDLNVGFVRHRVKHRKSCEDMTCQGCIPESEQVRYRELTLARMPAGVYGGTPGPIRERFANSADPAGDCTRWFSRYAKQRGWELESNGDEKRTA